MHADQGSRPVLSLILPFYRQDDHIGHVIDDFMRAFDTVGKTYELIVVVNGVEHLDRDHETIVDPNRPQVTIHRLRASGWGRAVTWGIEHAQGEYICYTNSARTQGKDVADLFAYALVSPEVIVKATRHERGTRMRKIISIFYNLENRLVLKTPIWDVNATPKFIPKKILDSIQLCSMGDTIDAELMYRAFRKNVPIIEIPIRQSGRRAGTSTTTWLSAAKMFWGILSVRTDRTVDNG